MKQLTLSQCFIKFCKTLNILLIPLIALAVYTVITQKTSHIIADISIGVILYYIFERKAHEDMHTKTWNPFYKSHYEHHINPTPETGVPKWWLFVTYYSIGVILFFLKLPLISGIWLGLISMLTIYEWVHFLCHCNYKPITKCGWKIRTNHLKHHNHKGLQYNNSDYYDMIFVKNNKNKEKRNVE